MVGRLPAGSAIPALPLLARLAPPPPPELVAARIDATTAPGEIVADPWGRGGWVARSAVDRQRRALTLESSPLTRLLAEVVLRPPDLRHLDAAVATLGTAPRGETSLRLLVAEPWTSRCGTCGRSVVLEEVLWTASGGEPAVPTARRYRCPICRDLRGGPLLREAPLEPADLERTRPNPAWAEHRARLRERFPAPEGAEGLPDELLALHTDRQLMGLAEILGGIEGELRAANVVAALRLALVHAVGPASRLAAPSGRVVSPRVGGGHLRPVNPDGWRERNPWLAFEEAYQLVREFVQRLEGSALGPLEARLGNDLRDLGDGAATAVAALATPDALERVTSDPGAGGESGRGTWGADRPPRVRLILGQPPLRPSTDRLAQAVHATGWALGRGAVELLPVAALAGSPIRAPWSWQSTMIRRALEAFGPTVGRDARAVLLVADGGAEAVAAALLGGVAAGWRLVDVRLPESGEGWGHVELVPPTGMLPPGPRSRANTPLEVVPGGAGDPAYAAGAGRFAAPERVDARPFSANEAARTVTETAVEVLRARGEPVAYERLLAEILVGLDRSGQLHRLAAAEPVGEPSTPFDPDVEPGVQPAGRGPGGADPGGSHLAGPRGGGPRIGTPAAATARAEPAADPVDRLLALVRDELARASGRRLVEVAPGRWWLNDPTDRAAAATPLSDRLEWAVYGILSTSGPISPSALRDRLLARFAGRDLPDEALMRACVESYAHPSDSGGRLTTHEEMRARMEEHARLLALLANGGHRLGMQVWLGRREQDRRVGPRRLAEFLEDRERTAYLPGIVRAPAEALEEVDCIWYVRGRAALAFEVEWTAMLGDLLLRRHARIPTDPALVRFLAIPGERRELVRHKLAASPVLQAALDEGGWQLITWPNLRAWLAREPLDLGSLEPYLGLDPRAERGEQLDLFGPPAAPDTFT